MKLEISEPSARHTGPILISDEDRNDIAEFFHNEHATVGQSYETALSLANALRAGVHLMATARSMGWKDDGEGAFEFMMRRCREVAFEDCGRDPSKDLRKVLEQMKKLYRIATYEGGYAITTGALLDFIREITKCLSSKT